MKRHKLRWWEAAMNTIFGIGGVVMFTWWWFMVRSLLPVGENLSQAETLSFYLTHPAKTPADHAAVQKLIHDYGFVAPRFPLLVKTVVCFAALTAMFCLMMALVNFLHFVRLFRQRNKEPLPDNLKPM